MRALTALCCVALGVLHAPLFAAEAAAASTGGVASPSADVEAECLRIERAFAVNDVERLAALRPEAAQWQALQAFRLAAAHIPAGDKRRARRVLNEGLRIVNRALRNPPAAAEAHAELLLLGAMLDGQVLLVDAWRFFHNGWRGLRRLRRAESLAPASPRAALVRGTAKVVLPAVFGGDAREAIALFAAADIDSALCERGEWAQVDILNWLARAHAELGEAEEARRYYDAALARSPGNHWVELAIAGRGYRWTEGDGADR